MLVQHEMLGLERQAACRGPAASWMSLPVHPIQPLTRSAGDPQRTVARLTSHYLRMPRHVPPLPSPVVAPLASFLSHAVLLLLRFLSTIPTRECCRWGQFLVGWSAMQHNL